MSKGTRTVVAVAPLAVLYVFMLLGIVPVPFLSTQVSDQILPVIPWWLLVAFGSYSLSSLGLGLVRFHDCPEAYEDLLKEIAQAKNELRDQGVSVD